MKKEYDGKVEFYSSSLLILSLHFNLLILFDEEGSFLILFVVLFANYISIETYRLQMFLLVESPYTRC
jgi:hypothetical protein